MNKIDSALNSFTKAVIKPTIQVETQLDTTMKSLGELEYKFKNFNLLIRDIVKKLIYAMESSLVSGKTVVNLAKEQSKLLPNDSAITINNKTSKPRFETPDRTREQYENIFLKRLSFLKNLLSDGNPGNENKENDLL